MSGHPAALPEMLENMNHGGRIAMLGCRAPHRDRLGQDRHPHVTVKGIYGREMFETWYAMSAMLRSGLVSHR
jgi:threonine 3-dehydrogenase